MLNRGCLPIIQVKNRKIEFLEHQDERGRRTCVFLLLIKKLVMAKTSVNSCLFPNLIHWQ